MISDVGAAASIVGASYLQPIHVRNGIVKYGDDTYLVVGASKRASVQEELNNVAELAALNNLKLKAAKSREMQIICSQSHHTS